MESKNNDINEIMQELEFGEINIKLDALLNDRNISTYELSTKSNIRFQTIKGLRENKSTRINFNVLAKLCYTLNCQVEDLIEYKEIK